MLQLERLLWPLAIARQWRQVSHFWHVSKIVSVLGFIHSFISDIYIAPLLDLSVWLRTQLSVAVSALA